jgi:hypothetical protein
MTISRGYTFGVTEEVTAAKLHTLIDSATVTDIGNAEISASAGIVDTKLATISTYGKVDGGAITGLANLSALAGLIPLANLSGLTTTQLSAAAGILGTQLETKIDDVGKLSGAGFTELANIPSGAGVIPLVNVPSTSVKIGSFTRDIATATDLTINNIGFTPSVVIFHASVAGNNTFSVGFGMVGANVSASLLGSSPAYSSNTGACFMLYDDSSKYTAVSIKSFASGEFVLQFSKTSTPVGTGTIGYLAIR